MSRIEGSNRMNLSLRNVILVVALLIACTSQCLAWNLPARSVVRFQSTRWSRSLEPQIGRRQSPLFSASPEESEEQKSASAEVVPKTPSPTETEEVDSSRGMTATILLAVPLFLKFVIVLLIKFATDLVVFPLLWTYRLARMTKRRVYKLFKKDSDMPVNGGSGKLSP